MAFTYRPTPQADAAIEQIKKKTGIIANSKVITHCLTRFLPVQAALEAEEKRRRDLQNELAKIKRILQDKQAADQQFIFLLDRISDNK